MDRRNFFRSLACAVLTSCARIYPAETAIQIQMPPTGSMFDRIIMDGLISDAIAGIYPAETPIQTLWAGTRQTGGWSPSTLDLQH